MKILLTLISAFFAFNTYAADKDLFITNLNEGEALYAECKSPIMGSGCFNTTGLPDGQRMVFLLGAAPIPISAIINCKDKTFKFDKGEFQKPSPKNAMFIAVKKICALPAF